MSIYENFALVKAKWDYSVEWDSVDFVASPLFAARYSFYLRLVSFNANLDRSWLNRSTFFYQVLRLFWLFDPSKIFHKYINNHYIDKFLQNFYWFLNWNWSFKGDKWLFFLNYFLSSFFNANTSCILWNV